ncbi:MAG: hypothetical protein LC136_09175 [Burkholderiales bacterium]|nr:hypothetical protein [Burkholderiales bacterium]
MDTQFAAAMRAVLDQKRPNVMRFVAMNPVEELGKLIERYAAGSHSDDATVVLDSLLAAYGLMTAILEHEERSRHDDERCGWTGLGTCPVCGDEVGRIL